MAQEDMMTPKERVLAVVNHREPDKVPLMYRDVPEVRARLKRDLGFADDEELYRGFDVDFRWAGPEWVGFERMRSNTERRDHWGIEWKYTPFSDTGGYWNEKAKPLAEEHDPAAAARYPLPDMAWWDFSSIADECTRHAEYAIMTSPGEASPGILQHPIQSLIGVERSLTDLYVNPEFMHALIDRVLEFHIPFVERITGEGRFDFFRVGDDYGTQKGPLMSAELWDEFFRQPLKRLADIARANGARFYLHSCGSVRTLIPSLIEIGVAVLDPLQVAADGMDPTGLKRDFGDRICFSGGVDEQELLPRGTPEQIREGVFRLLDTMMPGGGFILGPTHNLQDDIPTANVVAMYEAARDWSG